MGRRRALLGMLWDGFGMFLGISRDCVVTPRDTAGMLERVALTAASPGANLGLGARCL